MKVKVLASKQVGDVSYLVGDLEILYNIVEDEVILGSKKPEKNPRTGKPENYVSLSRNYTSAALRNNSRWKYGVLLDGDKLSDHYHIEPISYAGAVSKNLRLKTLTKYDDGECYAYFLNYGGSTRIPPYVYKQIEQTILNLSDEIKEHKKLVIQDGGKRRTRGRLIEKKYTFQVPNGLNINPKILDGGFTDLLKHTELNETEERIWLGSKTHISIHNCIVGLVLPKSTANQLDDPEGTLAMITEVMDKRNPGGWDLVTY